MPGINSTNLVLSALQNKKLDLTNLPSTVANVRVGTIGQRGKVPGVEISVKNPNTRIYSDNNPSYINEGTTHKAEVVHIDVAGEEIGHSSMMAEIYLAATDPLNKTDKGSLNDQYPHSDSEKRVRCLTLAYWNMMREQINGQKSNTDGQTSD